MRKNQGRKKKPHAEKKTKLVVWMRHELAHARFEACHHALRRASIPGDCPHAPIAGSVRLVLVLAHWAEAKKTPYHISGHRGEGGHVAWQVALAMKISPKVEPLDCMLLIKDRLFLDLHMHRKDASGFTPVELLLEVDRLRKVRGIFGFARFFFFHPSHEGFRRFRGGGGHINAQSITEGFSSFAILGEGSHEGKGRKGEGEGITFFNMRKPVSLAPGILDHQQATLWLVEPQ